MSWVVAIYSVLMVTARMSTPVLLSATGAIYSEKSGLPNITLDAAMIMGAFAAVYGSYFYSSSIVGTLFAMLAGAVVGILYAIVCLYLGGDETVVGISSNLIAWGLTTFLLPVVFGTTGSFISSDTVPLGKYSIPLLSQLPLVGGIFTNHTAITYFSWIFVFITWVVLYRTRWGLQIRSAGENQQAATTVGYHVRRIRFICSTITGIACGLAGAHLSLGLMTMFSEKMTAGRGFIALAAVTYAKASPKKVLFISVLFGLFDALSNQLQLLQWPSYIILMIPYLAVIFFVISDPILVERRKRKKSLP
jgi:ABC-type uncharacterized transport system permease subunit